jgi:cyclopropane fatty-acyl-phospholipid synthase-like methyltransferase
MNQPSAQATNWNQRYAANDYLFGKAPNHFLASQKARLRPGMRALSIADGEGRNGTWLAEQGADVLSVDFSDVALKKAARLADERGVKIRTLLADIAAWDWAGAPFDLIVAIFIQFADPTLRTKIFASIKKNLVPGGIVLLEGYRPKQLEYRTGGPPIAENLYTAALLRETFADLEILQLEEYDAVINEGAAHSGMSALVDLVARKPQA